MEKAKKEKEEMAKAKMKEAKARKDREMQRAEIKKAWGEKVFQCVRFAARMYRAGWSACESRDSYNTGWQTALRREGLYDSAMAVDCREFFSRIW